MMLLNEHLKNLHEKAEQCHLVWKSSGRSKSNRIQIKMQVSRLKFKYIITKEIYHQHLACNLYTLQKCEKRQLLEIHRLSLF